MSQKTNRWWQQWMIATDEMRTRVADALRVSPATSRSRLALQLNQLEPRLLFSATPLDVAAMAAASDSEGSDFAAEVANIDHNSSESESESIQSLAETASVDQTVAEFVFIDSTVPELQQLLDDLCQSGRILEIFVLDAGRDGVDQITEALDSRTDVSSIHIVSHAENGNIKLGNVWLGEANLDAYAGQMATWQSSLTSDADILLYGCDLAETASGRTFLDSITALTGADVAASDDGTGHASFASDWDLEYSHGSIETGVVFSSGFQDSWVGKLATITVDTLVDEENADSITSLREAINSATAGDTILLGAGTYNLTIDTLDINKDLSIIGADARTTIIDASALSKRVIHLHGTAVVDISGITIQGGDENNGGGILVDNSSTLNLTDAYLNDNHSDKGGAILVHGTANLNRVLIAGNTATVEGGGIHFQNADGGTLTNVTISGNMSSGQGGGVYIDTNNSVTISSSTITANVASNLGGGVVRQNGLVTLSNTIVAGNTASVADNDVKGTFFSNGFNLIQDVGSASGFSNDLTGIGAGLAALANNGGQTNTHALLTGSAADNTGSSLGTPTLDQVGNQRAAIVDIGAYESIAPTSKIYWTEKGSDAIYRSNGDGSMVQEILDGLGNPQGLEVDLEGGKIYWIETGTDSLHWANLDGTGEATISTTSLKNPTGLGLDLVNGHLYVADDGSGANKAIRRYNLDGTGETTIVSSLGETISDVAVDGVGGRIYYTYDDGFSYGGEIRSITLAGGDVQLLRTGLVGPQSLVIDQPAGHLYYTDDGSGSDYVQSINLSTGNWGITYASGGALIAPSGIAIDPESGKIYWADSVNDYIRRANVDGSGVEVVHTGLSMPQEIVALSLGGNTAPIAASGSYIINEGESLDLNASGSSDSDGTIVSYEWDLNNDGDFSDLVTSSSSITASWANLSTNWGIDNGASGGSVYAIGLRVTDDGGATATKTATVTVNNVAPTFSSGTTANVNEGETAVMTVAATDPADALTYSISGGADALLFDIDTNSGALTFLSAPDYENPGDAGSNNVYEVEVTADDGDGGTTGQAIAITVTNVNDAPVGLDDVYVIDEDTTLNSTDAWFDNAWGFRQTLTFDNAGRSEDLNGFPVLIQLDSSRIDYSETRNAGEDLRFVDSDGNVLSHQIESWDESGTSYVWVQVPQIDQASSTDFIWMYYGNSAATDGQDLEGTWSGDYVGVYHLHNDFWDRTEHDNDGSNNGSSDVTGRFGDAQSFDGNNDTIQIDSSATVDDIFDGGGTISAWVNLADWGENSYGRIIDKSSGTSPNPNGWSLHSDEANESLIFEYGFTGDVGRWRVEPNSISLNQWYHVAVVYDNSSAGNDPTIYINGVAQTISAKDAPSGTALSDAGLDINIGNYSAGNRTFDGLIDEVRLSSTAVSDQWVEAQYESGTDSLVTFGYVQTAAGVLGNDSDVDGDSLTATLVGGDPANASAFNFNADGTFTYTPDANFTGTDTFTYRISDGMSDSDLVTVTITVTAVNDLPAIGGTTDVAINDNATSQPFGTVTFSDVEGDDVTVVITVDTGDSAGVFTNASLTASGFSKTGTGEYTLTARSTADSQAAIRQLIFEPTENQVASGSTVATNFSISVQDSGTPVVDSTTDITVTSINDAPTIGSGTLASTNEGDLNPTGATVASILGSSFTDADASSSFSGIVVVGNSANPATQGVWQYTSNGTNWFNVGSVNDTGNGLVLAEASKIRFLSLTDFNGAPTALVVRGLDDSYGGSFSSTAVTESRQMLDTSSPSATSSFSNPTTTISTNVIANVAPVIGGTASGQAINDNQTASPFSAVTITDTEGDSVTVVITLSDGDSGGAFTAGSLATSGFTKTNTGEYSLATQTPANAQAAIRALVFDPTENQVAVGSVVTTTFTIVVDDGGTTTDSSTTVLATSINDAPTDITITSTNVSENSDGAVVGTISISDVDIDESFIATVDDARFEFSGAQLKLKSGEQLDSETEPTITLTLTVTDNGGTGLSYTETFTISVTDVNENPTDITMTKTTVRGSTPGAIVGRPTAVDPDSGDSHTYTVDDTRFTFTAGLLKLKPGQGIDHNSEPTVDVTITATDALGLSFAKTFTITVETPAIINPIGPPIDTGAGTGSTTTDPPEETTTDSESTEEKSDEEEETKSSEEVGAEGAGSADSGMMPGTIADAATVPGGADARIDLSVGNQTSGSESGRAANALVQTLLQEARSLSSSNDSTGTNRSEDSTRSGTSRFGVGNLTATLAQTNLAMMTKPGAMWDQLDQRMQGIESQMQGDLIVVGAAGAATSSFMVGVAAWGLRTGFLASGLMAQLPAWRAVDPLLIMQGNGDGDNESLEDLMKRRSEELDDLDVNEHSMDETLR